MRNELRLHFKCILNNKKIENSSGFNQLSIRAKIIFLCKIYCFYCWIVQSRFVNNRFTVKKKKINLYE